MSRSAKSAGLLLLAVLCLAAFLRLWGIDYGLPHQYLHDENVEVVRALRLGAGQYDWSFDRAQRGGYFYILFLEYGFYFLGLWIAGKVQGAGDFALHFVQNPAPFFFMGRLTTALFGTATVGCFTFSAADSPVARPAWPLPSSCPSPFFMSWSPTPSTWMCPSRFSRSFRFSI